jgi:acetyltransferase-like isoleucine patch superfamily enzyme
MWPVWSGCADGAIPEPAMRHAAKTLAFAAATVAVVPCLLSFAIRRLLLGPSRALEGSTQALSLWPGVTGDYLRRAFLGRVLANCDRSATVQFGTIFSQPGARLDENVYVGPRCHLGLVHLERDVLLAAGVHVPSGAATHGTSDLDRPIRDQAGQRALVRVGEGTWVGSAAVVLADVGKHCVVGAGAVVTHPLPDYVVAVGVPARVIRTRRSAAAMDD